MITPPGYAALRLSLPTVVGFGGGGIHLFKLSEIETEQVGYSVAPDGTSLCKGQGAWQPSWIVIGNETSCGDPLFIETGDPALPVLTAIHGEGAWDPVPISISLDAFAASLKELAQLSVGRANPVEQDTNPLSDYERSQFLSRISALNQRKIETDFWDVLLTC